MALTPGSVTVGTITSNSVVLTATQPGSGTPPFTYQWYRSTQTGFTPGVGNLIPGATTKDYTDTGLIPGTQYYYVLIATESGSTPDTATYTQASVVTQPQVVNPNQFAMVPYLGMIDMRFPYNSVSVLIDASQNTPLYAGAAVKMVDSKGGVPKVVACSADTDNALGFINYDIKNITFAAGQPAEISMGGNVMFLVATAAIARGARVVLETSSNGGVKAATGSTGDRVVGWAYDKATVPGELIRVFLTTPSFTLDS